MDTVIDLDIFRCAALRAPHFSPPGSSRPRTAWLQMDAIAEHAAVNRPAVLANLLADFLKVDPAMAHTIADSGVARQVRSEYLQRKEAVSTLELEAPPLVERHKL